MSTSLEELKKIKLTEEKQLPPFIDGTPFVAELKKISLVDVICNSHVPNPIIKTVMKVLGDNKSQNSELQDQAIDQIMNDSPAETMKFMFTVVEKSLVSPTYDEIKQCGVSLTDAQIFAIFSYAMSSTETEALSKFC